MDNPREYTVYCDESRQGGTHSHMAIGGLWVPLDLKKGFTEQLRSLKSEVGLAGEIKWSKVSVKKLESYQRWVDFFFDNEMNFRAILVDQTRVDYTTFKGGDDELGFYTFYYEMLIKWIFAPNSYHLLLDFKKNREHDRPQVLKQCLDHKIPAGSKIRSLNVIDSADSPIAQLTDVLTGATAAVWCGIDPSSPKGKLAQYIADRSGRSSLKWKDPAPYFSKLNLFSIDLR